MNADSQFDENAACDTCGCFGAYRFDGHWLCLDCYEARGSCCAEAEPKPKPAPCEKKPEPQRDDRANHPRRA